MKMWEQAWKSRRNDFIGAIEDVTNLSKDWNCKVFGNIFRKKRKLKVKIKGISESTYYNTSRGLQNFEKRLIMDLNVVLKQGELFWFQKSCKAWVQDGDRNTSFYHRSTIIRRSRGLIRILKVNDGWTFDEKILIDHVNNFFSILFGWVERQAVLGSDQRNYLGGSQESGYGDETLGQPKTRWYPGSLLSILLGYSQEEYHEMANTTISTSRVPINMLEALIALIQKNDHQETVGGFRSITLLNVIFKIISKVIVNKMRPLMQQLIGPFQNSFLLGRLSAFRPERGLRQGDPLAPYLFIHAMERLSLLIQKKVDSAHWKPISWVYGDFPPLLCKRSHVIW